MEIMDLCARFGSQGLGFNKPKPFKRRSVKVHLLHPPYLKDVYRTIHPTP